MENTETYKRLFELIKSSRGSGVCAFTGAGISTLSGIPDFRGVNGVYNTTFMGHNPEDILHIDFFYAHPDIFYAWCKDVWYDLDRYEPNVVHRVLAKMQKAGLVGDIFTQNIDMLHTRAGSSNVYELHGSARINKCTRCAKEFSYDEVAPIIRSSKVPYCDKCGGLIKPNIVLYGEGLDSATLTHAEKACKNAELLLVLGSSLTVQPASILPQLTLSGGGKVVVVNSTLTYIDSYAELKLSDLEAVFTALDNLLNADLSTTSRACD